MFWLINVTFNFFPGFAIGRPVPLLLVLTLVVGVGMAKDLISDLRRQNEDKITNAREVPIVVRRGDQINE